MIKARISLTLILLSALLATTFTGCREKPSDEDRTYYSELRAVKKLVTGRMTISKMATIDDIRLDEAQGLRQTASALLAAIKPGSRKAAYSYNTYLRAYIDMDRLTPDDIRLSTDGKTLEIDLPPVEIEFAGRDAEICEEHYRVTGLRSNINADERARLKEEMNTLLKEEVRRNPAIASRLKEIAETKAATFFTDWGRNRGLNVMINFSE